MPASARSGGASDRSQRHTAYVPPSSPRSATTKIPNVLRAVIVSGTYCSCGRDRQPDVGSATGPVGRARLAAVRPGDDVDDGEAEPGATACPRLVAPRDAVEGRGQDIG